MGYSDFDGHSKPAWNVGRKEGPKRALKQKEVWASGNDRSAQNWATGPVRDSRTDKSDTTDMVGAPRWCAERFCLPEPNRPHQPSQHPTVWPPSWRMGVRDRFEASGLRHTLAAWAKASIIYEQTGNSARRTDTVRPRQDREHCAISRCGHRRCSRTRRSDWGL